MLNIAILGSTNGSNVLPLMKALQVRQVPAKIALIISNRPNAGILTKAKITDIPSICLPSKGMSRGAHEKEMQQHLEAQPIDLLLLIGYMRLLSPWFVAQWKGKILNVHPSLLPDYAGMMDMEIHQQVCRDGRTESGCSVHQVTESLDEGPVLVQKRCPVFPSDRPEILKARVQALEVNALADAIVLFSEVQHASSPC